MVVFSDTTGSRTPLSASQVGTPVTTATELSEATYDKIKNFVKKTFDADAEMEVRIDPSLIGGFILDIENTRMDASVAGQLNTLKNKLTGST